jgi:protoporphyrinogen oxidase
VREVSSNQSDGVTLRLKDGLTHNVDSAVVTVPSPLAAAMCTGLTPEEQQLLEGVQYQGIVCCSTLLDAPLAGFYITNITDSWVPFTAVIEMSALVDRDEFDGKTLIYLPRYLASDDPSFAVSDEEWELRFTEALLRMYPHLRRDDFAAFAVSRERFVYALPTRDYSTRLPKKKTSIPRVHLVNSAHIVNGTLNVNETIRLAEESVSDLIADEPRTTDQEALEAAG